MKKNAANFTEHENYWVKKSFRELCPRVLPGWWIELSRYPNAASFAERGGLRVILEVELVDGALWLHASCSRAERLPSWEDLRAMKNLFIGRERKAIQVLPAEAEYVNLHPFVLHLYAPLDKDPLPDLRMQQADGVVGV